MDQSPNLATMRLAGMFAFCYMSVYKPAPVAEFVLTATPATGATALAVSYTVGSESDTRQGFYIRFYDGSSGAFKGDSRVRNSGSRTSASLPVRELAYGHAKLSSGDVGKVYPYVPLDTKLVDASAQFNPDGESYADEGLHPPPVVNFGSHYAGWANSSGYALVTGKGSTSFLVDPGSSTPVTHFSSGSSGIAFHTGSSNTDANPVFEVSPGQQWVEHVGSDSDNGRSGTNFLAYMVHDAAHPPYEVFLPTPPTGDPVTGWSWTVELITAADLESIWDGALCVLWVDEYIAGVKQSFRGNNDDRSHILGIGYARRDTSTGSADRGDRITFEIQSPIARIAEIASYSKVMQEATVPASWSQDNTLGVKRALIGLRQNYTFMQEAGYDFFVHSLYSDARYPAFYIQRSDVIAQMQELANGRKSRVVNKLRGAAFELQPHPAYLSMSDRASVTINAILTDDDVSDYTVTRDHQDSLEIFELQGITAGASGNVSAYSRFPGLSPAGGKQYTVQGKYIPDSQGAQNADCAMMGAFIQQIFIDSTTSNAKQRVGEMTLNLPGAYGFFDWELEYTKFNYADDLRGVDYNGLRCWLKRFQTNIDESTGEWQYQAVFQQETASPADGAQTFTPLDSTTTPIPNPTLPTFPPITITPPFGGLIPRGALNMALICANGIALTDGFNAVNPVWTFIAWATLSVSGTVIGWCPRGGTTAGWLITTTKVYYLDISTLTATDKHTFADTTSKRSLDAAFPTSGLHFVVSSYIDGVGVKVLRTTDNSTFTEISLSTNHPSDDSSFGILPGCFVSTKAAGRVYTSHYNVAGSIAGLTAASVGDTSSNYGATFGALTMQSSGILAQHIHVPWNNNPNDAIYFYSAATLGLYRNTTNVSPSIGGSPYGPRTRDTVQTSVSNSNRLLAVMQASLSTDYAVFLTNNAQATTPTWTVLEAPGTDARRGAISGDDPNHGWVWGTNNKIDQLTISGTTGTFSSKSGNLSSLSAGDIIAIAGY